MSLLEKASRGTGTSSPQAPTSLFTRALSAREPGASFGMQGLGELERRLRALPPCEDSVLAAWSFVSELIPLAAIALFLPRGDFLAPAALLGFPSSGADAIPMSFASPSQRGAQALGKEERALLAPILGVPLSLSLRAASMISDSGFVGLWVYHDPSLDSATAETQIKLGAALAGSGAALPALSIAAPVADPARRLFEAARKYPSASIFSFDLSPSYAREDPRFRGLDSILRCSAFLAACARILSQGGAALAYGERRIGCILGSSSPVDPELAFFQFTKTLRRLVPYLAAASFPAGRTLGIQPSSERAFEDLSRFLSA
jgi:hypothetical protein